MKPIPSIVRLALGATGALRPTETPMREGVHKWFAWYKYDGLADDVPRVTFAPAPEGGRQLRALPALKFTVRVHYKRWIVSSLGAPRFL